MRELVMRYFRGQALNIDECVKLMEEYMKKTNKHNPTLIQKLIDPMNPFGPAMLQYAVDVSARSLAEEYTITRLYSKEGNLLMVY
jgi:hypothetical protein